MEKQRPPEAKRPIPKEEEAKPEEEIVEIKKSPEGRLDIDVTFIYCWHTLEFFEDIYQKVKGADVICLEMTGKTREEREEKAAEWNHILALAQEAPNDPDVQQTIKNGKVLAQIRWPPLRPIAGGRRRQGDQIHRYQRGTPRVP